MGTVGSDVLLPFHQSRDARRAYLARTRSLLSALDSDHSEDGVTFLTLPNLERGGVDDERERRPTSTYAIRPLSEKERAMLLEPMGCNCRLLPGDDDDDVKIKVMYRVAGNGEGHRAMAKWDVTSSLKAQVGNTRFGGKVLIGVLLDGPDPDPPAPSSISTLAGATDNRLVRNSILEPGCAVHGNTEVSDTHVMRHASVIGCGAVTCPEAHVDENKGECNFDMARGSMDVEVGPEAGGGRIVNARVESTLVDVCRDLKMDSNGGGTTIAPLVTFDETDEDDAPAPSMNVLCPRSSLLHTPKVAHVHLLPHAAIDSATSVESAVLLPHAAIRHGCTVSRALIQWNAAITSGSDARSVFLMERAEVGPHSFCANAIFGPDSHVSGGEVHATLFGPNANSHHQSLLIGILWPLGRGNVGYGSNVGSNHTGRIPDQETSVGEGTFWGLGSVIKFPVDLTSAPYSIVAAGVQLPPQRIRLPFSLITDGPGGMNQLTPGWLLHYSPYTVARSEVKFASRRKAKRHDFYTGWKIMRAGTVDLLVDARDMLVRAGEGQRQSAGEGKASMGPENAVYKTDRAIPGLGANQLAEKGRRIGIRAYTDAIQRYALRGLLDRLVRLSKDRKDVSLGDALRHAGLDGVDLGREPWAAAAGGAVAVNWPVLPWNEASHADANASWEHVRSTLRGELPSILGEGGGNKVDVLSRLLRKCAALEDDHAERVYKSKSRDDARGAKTVPGYEEAHVCAEKDSVVLAAKEEAEGVRRDVQMLERVLGVIDAPMSRL